MVIRPTIAEIASALDYRQLWNDQRSAFLHMAPVACFCCCVHHLHNPILRHSLHAQLAPAPNTHIHQVWVMLIPKWGLRRSVPVKEGSFGMIL